MNKYILALDCSSSACKAALIDRDGRIFREVSRPITTHRPFEGWVEHDANEIWEAQYGAMLEVLGDIDPEAIQCIGLSNQRETVVCWDRNRIYPVISWQDNREPEFLNKFRNYEDEIRKRTGLVLSPYFSAPKISWIVRHHEIDLPSFHAGTIDTWIILNLTQGRSLYTDVTNASRTMLFNVRDLEWDIGLLCMFGIPPHAMPRVKSTVDYFGWWEHGGHRIPIRAVAGDQQAALFQCSYARDNTPILTYGTGAFLLASIGKNFSLRENYVTTIAWKVLNWPTQYAMEGGIHLCGNFLEELRGAGHFIDYSISDTVPIDSILFPIGNRKLLIFGDDPSLCQEYNLPPPGEGRLKATLNGIALSSNDLLKPMRDTLGLTHIFIGGQLTKLPYLLNIQASISQLTLMAPDMHNGSLLGVAYMAGLAQDLWTHYDLVRMARENLMGNEIIPAPMPRMGALARWG